MVWCTNHRNLTLEKVLHIRLVKKTKKNPKLVRVVMVRKEGCLIEYLISHVTLQVCSDFFNI